MAGSYKHVVTDDGNLRSNESVARMLETGGDVFEAVEEMYGMIWFLAHQSVAAHVAPDQLRSLQFSREAMKDVVRCARANYEEGLKMAREANRRPDGEL